MHTTNLCIFNILFILRCACGRSEHWHVQNGTAKMDPDHPEKWHPYKHTEQRVTDAYGTIEFQGGPHPSKAQYIRLSSLDTRQENVLTLLIKVSTVCEKRLKLSEILLSLNLHIIKYL